MEKIKLFAVEDYCTTKFHTPDEKLPFILFTKFNNIGLIYLN